MAPKRIRRIAVISVLTLLSIISFSKAVNRDGNFVQAMSANAENDIYKETLTVSLLKELQQASNRYYDGSYSVFPTVELVTTKLEQICKQEGKTILEFKIMPFIGPHNTVGVDHITLSLDHRGNVTVLDYQHSENF